jgi:hypothetical protein
VPSVTPLWFGPQCVGSCGTERDEPTQRHRSPIGTAATENMSFKADARISFTPRLMVGAGEHSRGGNRVRLFLLSGRRAGAATRSVSRSPASAATAKDSGQAEPRPSRARSGFGRGVLKASHGSVIGAASPPDKKTVMARLRRVGLWAVLASVLSVRGLFASEYRGQVTFSGVPIPGATVTATQGDVKLVAITDPMGSYVFSDLPDGAWAIRWRCRGSQR